MNDSNQGSRHASQKQQSSLLYAEDHNPLAEPESDLWHTRRFYGLESIRRAEQSWFLQHPEDQANWMDRAGQAVLDLLTSDQLSCMHKGRDPKDMFIVVLVGPGNNGGDALTFAHLAACAGFRRIALSCPMRESWSPVLQQRWLRCSQQNAIVCLEEPDWQSSPDWVVDGFLGSGGSSRELPDALKPWIAWANARAQDRIIALDIPSGLTHFQAQERMPTDHEVIRARLTLTFLAHKTLLQTGWGPAYAGQVLLQDLGVGAALLKDVCPEANACFELRISQMLPKRLATAHKYDHGPVVILVGNMPGAAILAAKASLAVGAGRVCLVAQTALVSWIAITHPQITVTAYEDEVALKKILAQAKAVVIGPGLGHDKQAEAWVEKTMTALPATTPLLIDADGLRFEPYWRNHPRLCLTPHAGEAKRLIGNSTAILSHDSRFGALNELTQRYQATVVLKGAGPLIGHFRLSSDQEGEVMPTMIPQAAPVLAVAGSGDVLSGVLAGLIAQCSSWQDAVVYGVWLHLHAAELWASDYGDRGLDFDAWLLNMRRLLSITTDKQWLSSTCMAIKAKLHQREIGDNHGQVMDDYN